MKKRGFTLIELLGVITILAIIAIVSVTVINSTLSKQREKVYYDQLSQLVKASQNYGTDNSEKFNHLKSGCNLENWYRITLEELQNLENSNPISYLDKNFINPKDNNNNFSPDTTYAWVYKQDNAYLYCVVAEECTNAKYTEYKDIASKICCDGEDFQRRINGCPYPDLDITEPTADYTPKGWSQSKTATVDFLGTGNFFIKSNVEVTLDIPSTACYYLENELYLCEEEQVSANTKLLPNLWYKVESNPTLTYLESGELLYKAVNRRKYTEELKLPIPEIDRRAPEIKSFTASTNSSNVITLTASATDNGGSGIKQYDFYNGTTLIKTVTTSEESASVTYTSSTQGNLTFNVVVTDNVGLISEKPLVESCKKNDALSTSCYKGDKTIYYECEGTGRKYSYTTSVGCPCDNYTSSSSCSTYCSGYGYAYGSQTAVYNCRDQFQYYSGSCSASCPTTTTTRTTTKTTTRTTTNTTTTRTTTRTTTNTTTTRTTTPTTTTPEPATTTCSGYYYGYETCSKTCSGSKQVITGTQKMKYSCKNGKGTKDGNCDYGSATCPTCSGGKWINGECCSKSSTKSKTCSVYCDGYGNIEGTQTVTTYTCPSGATSTSTGACSVSSSNCPTTSSGSSSDSGGESCKKVVEGTCSAYCGWESRGGCTSMSWTYYSDCEHTKILSYECPCIDLQPYSCKQ